MSSLNQHLIAIDYAIGNRIAPPDPILDNNSWETISLIARAGRASQYWNIGDYKSQVIGGVLWRCSVVDFDHDIVTNPDEYGKETAGITFQFGRLYPNATPGLYETARLANTNAYAGGWAACVMRITHCTGLYNNMPDDIKLYMVSVNKSTAQPHVGTIDITSDVIFIPSVAEVYGDIVTNQFDGEGTQYAAYTSGSGYIIRYNTNNAAAAYWTRSPRAGTTSGATQTFFVSTSASVGSQTPNQLGSYFAPMFCV